MFIVIGVPAVLSVGFPLIVAGLLCVLAHRERPPDQTRSDCQRRRGQTPTHGCLITTLPRLAEPVLYHRRWDRGGALSYATTSSEDALSSARAASVGEN
jgi:hypothetical protein